MNRWATYAGDLFIVAKVCGEPATLLELTNNRRMVPQCATDSLEPHSSGFEFRVFPSPRLIALPKLETPIYTTFLPSFGIYIYIYIYGGLSHRER